MTTVVTATSADVNAIAAAEREYIDCPWTAGQIAEEIESDGVIFLTARTDGEFSGYVSCRLAADECEIANIAVMQTFRRQGIGRMLLYELIRRAAERGGKKLFLLVREDNTAAEALYASIGFTAAGKRKGYYGGKNAIIMMRNI